MLIVLFRIFSACFLLVILTPIAQAQVDRNGCLSGNASDNRLVRVSGKIIHIRIEHPLQHYVLDGYALELLQPRCFDTFSPQTGQALRLEITQIGLLPIFSSHSAEAQKEFWAGGKNRYRWDEMDAVVADNVGKFMTVIGTVEDNSGLQYLVERQIAVGSYAPCEIAPKLNAIEKC
jgi:hypothetical protein